jgi:hypothetical protein
MESHRHSRTIHILKFAFANLSIVHGCELDFSEQVAPQEIGGDKPYMSDKSIGDIWQRLNFWQKLLLLIFAGIWVVISAGIVLATEGNWILTVGSVLAVWLVYIALAFVISRDYRK